MSITVYTKRVCVQCKATLRKLDQGAVTYQTVNLDENPEALEFIKGLGALQAPVVVQNADRVVDHWSGFRPDKIYTISPQNAV